MTDHIDEKRIGELRRKLSLPERMDGNDWTDIAAILDDYSAMRAENKTLKEELSGNDAAHRLALAELARQAPLIQAVMMDGIFKRAHGLWEEGVYRAALALREEEK